jgi:hypothetical protein
MEPKPGVRPTYPIGRCYCCGEPISNRTTKFLRGHDQRLAFRVIAEQYGDVADFAVHHGYEPPQRQEVPA